MPRCLVIFLQLAVPALLLSGNEERGETPFEAYNCAAKVEKAQSAGAIAQYVRAIESGTAPPALKDYCAAALTGDMTARDRKAANGFLLLAELAKAIGDPRASLYYEKAIDLDPNEAAHNLFYGDYLRNFRGPQEPLFPAAEEQYSRGQRTLAHVREKKLSRPWDDKIASRIERSLVALHQRDGAPLFFRNDKTPELYFASISRFARADDDLDRTSDVRDYTAEAAFASSSQRKDAPLTRNELRSIIRPETAIDTFDRFRLRTGDWPVLDLYYNFRHTDGAAITSYFPPFAFNPLQLNSWGASIAKPFTVGGGVDVAVEGSFQQSWRRGLVEFHPDGLERINQFEGRVALAKFLRRDKLNVSLSYAHQAISPDVANNPRRQRQFLAPSVSYGIFRPSTFGEHFETRGIEVFGGALLDRETYPAAPGTGTPDTVVRRGDYFGGISLRGLGGGRWDFTVQPTFFSSAVRPDQTQNNSQYRTNVVALYRIVDEEKQPEIPGGQLEGASSHLAFLHLTFPLSQDVARQGIAAFRNYKAGVELDSMWYTTVRPGISFLGSVRYDFQRFYVLNKNENLFTIGVSMGF